jgi:50S ribosomal protein L16 3-hydroxylase
MKPDAQTATARLHDLVGPLSVAEFVDGHWLPGRPHLGKVSAALLPLLSGLAGLDGPGSLMARHRRDVRVFGPSGERAVVPAAEGLDWLHRGHTLYADHIHRTVPEAHELMAGVAVDLGLEPWQMTMEGFAGRAGSVSTRHFDHDVTIQILLAGEKEWGFEPNGNVANPLQPFHPPRAGGDPMAAFGEEAYADGPMVLGADPSPAVTLHATPGTAVFLPRGWWHRTRSLTDTWSVNVVFHSVSWARAFGRALEIRLHAEARHRAYCGGFGAPVVRTAADDEHRRTTLASLRASARRAIDEITADEAALAMLGFIGRTYRWSPTADDRRVRSGLTGWVLAVGDRSMPIGERSVPGVEALCRLTANFRWDHIPPLLAGTPADPGEVYAVLAGLTDLGAVEVVRAGLGA